MIVVPGKNGQTTSMFNRCPLHRIYSQGISFHSQQHQNLILAMIRNSLKNWYCHHQKSVALPPLHRKPTLSSNRLSRPECPPVVPLSEGTTIWPKGTGFPPGSMKNAPVASDRDESQHRGIEKESRTNTSAVTSGKRRPHQDKRSQPAANKMNYRDSG